jgi:hypothetical protein
VDQQRGEDTPEAAAVGDVVTLKVDVSGAGDGTRITFRVFDTSESPESRVGVARGQVNGGIGTAEWTVKTRQKKPKLMFDGEVRRASSERAEISIIAEFAFSI